MTLMKSSDLAHRLAVAGLEPIGRGEAGDLAGQHVGQTVADGFAEFAFGQDGSSQRAAFMFVAM